MNPLRYVRGDIDPFFVSMVVLSVAVLAVASIGRRREKTTRERGERGGQGYHPADLRDQTTAVPPPADPEDAWLLGLAAPLVESAGMLHHAWALVPQPRDTAWQRHLHRWLAAYGAGSLQQWQAQLHSTEVGPWDSGEADPDAGPFLVGHHSMLCRLGVAAGYIDAAEARRRALALANPLRSTHVDWFTYADAFVATTKIRAPQEAMALAATIRTLFGPGEPWSDPAWPMIDSDPADS